jgi:hypothetical protein
MSPRPFEASGIAAILHSARGGVFIGVLFSMTPPASAQLPSNVSPEELRRMDALALVRLLDERRPAPVSAAVRAQVLADLPRKGDVQDLSASERRKLAAIGPVLDVAQRQSVYAIKVVDVPHAFIGIHERSVILITRSALKIASEEELRAAVSHEAAHEYVHADYERARIDARRSRLQDLELVCDMIAVVTLRTIGQEALTLPAVIEKIQRFNRFHFGYEPDPDYPEVLLRRSVILALEKRLPRSTDLRVAAKQASQ